MAPQVITEVIRRSGVRGITSGQLHAELERIVRDGKSPRGFTGAQLQLEFDRILRNAKWFWDDPYVPAFTPSISSMRVVLAQLEAQGEIFSTSIDGSDPHQRTYFAADELVA